MSLNVTKELTALARKLGYSGPALKTVAEAINAITSVAGSSSGGDGCDCDPGYKVEETQMQLFNETVTTELDSESPDDPACGYFAYSTQITADTITVTFDGTDYVCEKFTMLGANAYGGWDDDEVNFTDYPFVILSSPITNEIRTPTSGTHTVSVAGTSRSIETTPAFEAAVNSVADTSTMPMECVSGVTTFADMTRAYGAGRILFFKTHEEIMQTKYITGIIGSTVTFIPEDSSVDATFVNDVFTVDASVV